jgi:hypothetical protein
VRVGPVGGGLIGARGVSGHGRSSRGA